MTSRVALPERILADRVVVVLRTAEPTHVDVVAEVLVAEGLGCLEVTFTIPQAEQAISRLCDRFGKAVSVGAGTVTTRARAVAAVEHGAAYIVSPVFHAEVAEVALAAGIPYLPGALTPTEISLAWEGGASAVKVFPASAVQPSYLRAVLGPPPDVQLLPSGGVALDAVQGWLDAGAVAVSLGGELIGDALAGGRLEDLRVRARAVAGLR
ncbi:MAG: 2-dehydro-3-deoxyphosphogluconate aldolase / (4S)-4-hydroxy-2-oxoglutarate aldolase [Frankiales bacterium]|nr:2-dehydro-3-deoxyphosphogluconate aldolase / (4S)-4-hydroxy-2-oxoglutarate aldolase [Frankiales bacterium]